ncbi:hypothetical protein PVV25_03710, partial [Salmonella enterica subsp. enterica serovar Typhimurium]|uniref:hypothetical protein n=1 Tax=Salmonella enterica TaxID=28901 RepID=UPI002FFC8677
MISMTKADLRLAVQRLISSSIVMLMSVISTHYDLSRISVGHYSDLLAIDIPAHINDSISLFPVHCSPDQLTVQYMTVLFHFATPNFF